MYIRDRAKERAPSLFTNVYSYYCTILFCNKKSRLINDARRDVRDAAIPRGPGEIHATSVAKGATKSYCGKYDNLRYLISFVQLQ